MILRRRKKKTTKLSPLLRLNRSPASLPKKRRSVRKNQKLRVVLKSERLNSQAKQRKPNRLTRN